ncbi:MAG: ATP-binding protein [Chitinophagaceae bacterium]
MKIKVKITTLFTLLVTAILLLLSTSIYYFTALQRKDAFSKRLLGRATNNAQMLSVLYNNPNALAIIKNLDSASAGTLPRKSVYIYNYLDEQIYRFDVNPADTLTIDKEVLREARLNHITYFTNTGRDGLALHFTDANTRIVIVVASYDDDGWNRLKQLRNILVLSLLVGIFVTLIVGYLFSRQLVEPIMQIIGEVNDISSQNLSQRLQPGSSRDELNHLANTFNLLLDRLQDSFNTQRRFISNASHELSTPLTSISSQLEVALSKERSSEEYQQVMQSVWEDVQEMQHLTKSLLELAKAGSQGSIGLSEVRIDETLFRVTSSVQKIHDSYEVELHFGDFPEDEKSFVVFGNGDLLYSALKNVVENGCKYSHEHLASVELSFAHDDVIVKVYNKGAVIPADEMEHIFHPFYRTADASQAKGFGLGLALARRIIAMHKGSISVQSDAVNGTVFTVILPSAKAFTER